MQATLHRGLAVGLGLVAGFLFAELGLRVFFDRVVPPRYHVLNVQPDPQVGWKHVADLEYTWTGREWVSLGLDTAEFEVRVKINSEGFRDRQRAAQKPPGTVRVALLGDSLLAALQVPREQTAARILERSLNERLGAAGVRYEVLNFGVPGHSLGQSLLVYENYARSYAPDVVFVLVGYLQMRRTIDAKLHYRVRARPTFHLEEGRLVHTPADYEGYLEGWNQTRRETFGGGHSRRLYLNTLASDEAALFDGPGRWLWAHSYFLQKLRPLAAPRSPSWEPASIPEVLSVNERVLRALRERTRSDGARLVLADVTLALNPSRRHVAARVAELGETLEAGYVPVALRLREAERSGLRTRFRYDAHFTADGNRVFAESLLAWFATDARDHGALRGAR